MKEQDCNVLQMPKILQNNLPLFALLRTHTRSHSLKRVLLKLVPLVIATIFSC